MEMQSSAIRTIVPLYKMTTEAQSPAFYAAVKPLETIERWRQDFRTIAA